MNDETPALTQPPLAAQTSRKDDAVPPAAAGDGAGAPPAGKAADRVANDPARSPVAWWALLLALLALGGAGWAGWQARDTHVQAAALREELAQRLAEGETAATEARGIVRQQQETIAALQGKLGVLESKVEATEGQAAALEELYQEFSRSREDGVLAEVEQAVALAAQQLQLAGNIEAALIALQEADARLAVHDRGQFAPLRRALAADIEVLKLQPVLDVSGLGLRLERLLERADAMPLAFEGQLPANEGDETTSPAAATADEDWFQAGLQFAQRLALDVWREVRSLVRVERLDQDNPVLLAPAQNTFLRENLKIRLLTARLALLARDGRTYAADLAQARAWVERFFDRRDARVQAALDELKALESVSVRYEAPNLTESFAALRTLQAKGGRRPVPGEAPAAAPAPDAAPAGAGGGAEPAADAPAAPGADTTGEPPAAAE